MKIRNVFYSLCFLIVFVCVSCASTHIRVYDPIAKQIEVSQTVQHEIHEGDIIGYENKVVQTGERIEAKFPNKPKYGPTSYGWSELRYFKDEYDRDTNIKYTVQTLEGTFNNSAVTNEYLNGFVSFDESYTYQIYLYRYGSSPIKDIDVDKNYKISIYDKNSIYYEGDCWLTDCFVVTLTKSVIEKLFNIEGDISFRIQNTKYRSEVYKFTISNSSFYYRFYEMIPDSYKTARVEVKENTVKVPIFAEKDETIIEDVITTETKKATFKGYVTSTELKSHFLFCGKSKSIDRTEDEHLIYSDLLEKAKKTYGDKVFIHKIYEESKWHPLSLIYYFSMLGYFDKTTWVGEVYSFED